MTAEISNGISIVSAPRIRTNIRGHYNQILALLAKIGKYSAILLTVIGMTTEAEALAVDVPDNDLAGLLWRHDEPKRIADVHGKVLTLEYFKDNLVIITFVSADCTILCVKRMMDIDKLARKLPEFLRKRVVFLALDTDPQADSSGRLRAFADNLLEPGSPLTFVRTNVEVATSVMEKLRYPVSALPEPPPTILLFDRRGRVAMSYGGDPLDTSRLERDLAALDTFTEGLGHRPADAPAETQPSR